MLRMNCWVAGAERGSQEDQLRLPESPPDIVEAVDEDRRHRVGVHALEQLKGDSLKMITSELQKLSMNL